MNKLRMLLTVTVLITTAQQSWGAEQETQSTEIIDRQRRNSTEMIDHWSIYGSGRLLVLPPSKDLCDIFGAEAKELEIPFGYSESDFDILRDKMPRREDRNIKAVLIDYMEILYTIKSVSHRSCSHRYGEEGDPRRLNQIVCHSELTKRLMELKDLGNPEDLERTIQELLVKKLATIDTKNS